MCDEKSWGFSCAQFNLGRIIVTVLLGVATFPPQTLVGCGFFATVPVHMRPWLCIVLLLLAAHIRAAELKIDFSQYREGENPSEPRKSGNGDVSEVETVPQFRSAAIGQGKPGKWQIVLDDAPSLLPSLGT